MSEEHEIERSVTREEAVATIQAVVDGVASGTLRFDAADVESVDVDVPDVVDLEVELERGDDGGVELEIELEWPVAAASEPGSSQEDHTAEPSDAQAAGQSEAQGVESPEGQPAESATKQANEPPSEQTTESATEQAAESPAEQATESTAKQAADLRANGPHAIDTAVLGPAEPRESLARFEVYLDRAEEWRWRLVHHNGNVIADGGEGYTSKQSALKGLRSVMANAPGATVRDESKK
jgi:amphi-Trp domain-containing protein